MTNPGGRQPPRERRNEGAIRSGPSDGKGTLARFSWVVPMFGLEAVVAVAFGCGASPFGGSSLN